MRSTYSFKKYTNFTHSKRAFLFKKNYDDIFVEVIIKFPQTIKNKTRRMAIDILRDDLIDLLNDRELANLFKIQENATGK